MTLRSSFVALVLVSLVGCSSDDSPASSNGGSGGSAGESGFAGVSGTAGFSGTAGTSSFAGVAGSAGFAGGLAGVSGASGAGGIAGSNGGTAGLGGIGGMGGGGTGGDGNGSFSTAIPIDTSGGALSGVIEPDSSDIDYYYFEGNKGDWLYLHVDVPKPNSVGDDDHTYLDPVLILYNAAGEQIAFNDDGLPRTSQDSQVTVRLPDDGVYYLAVEHYCLAFGVTCPGSVLNDYTVSVRGLPASGVTPIGVFEIEPNDNAQSAQPVDAFVVTPTTLFQQWLLSDFSSEGDVDTYMLYIPPANYPSDPFQLGLTLQPEGPSGNGSTARVGNVRVWTDSGSQADPFSVINVQEMLALGNSWGVGAELDIDVVPDSHVFIEVTRESGSLVNDFYTITPYPFALFEYENEDVNSHSNDSLNTATLLNNPKTAGSATSYVVGGLLPQNDVDYLRVTLPQGASSIETVCYSSQRGSAIRGFNLEALDENETVISASFAKDNAEGFVRRYSASQFSSNTMYARISANQDPQPWRPWYVCWFFILLSLLMSITSRRASDSAALFVVDTVDVRLVLIRHDIAF